MDNTSTALIIALIFALIYLIAWVRSYIRWRRAKAKKKASVPVDYSGRIREQGRELRRITYRGDKGA